MTTRHGATQRGGGEEKEETPRRELSLSLSVSGVLFAAE